MGINREIPCHPPHHNIGQAALHKRADLLSAGAGPEKKHVLPPFKLGLKIFGRIINGLQRALNIYGCCAQPTIQNLNIQNAARNLCVGEYVSK